MKPVLLAVGHVPPDRLGAIHALHDAEGIVLALYGGRHHHGTAGVEDPGVPHLRVPQRTVLRLAASGRHRAVIATSTGRTAMPTAYLGARLARIPFLYWTGIWAQVRTPAHLLGAPAVRWIERDADATLAYGTHVAAYARGHGARNVHIAPQTVDVGFWSASAAGAQVARRRAGDPQLLVLYAGRTARGKGLGVLLDAWRRLDAKPADATLLLAGPTPAEVAGAPRGVSALGPLNALALRDLYAAADVLVVPSVHTREFREPWGLVVNEALLQGTCVIASDSVGAAAGGLVRHERTGLVVADGDPRALADAIERLRRDPALRGRLGEAGRQAALRLTPEAFASAVGAALRTVSAARAAC